MTARPEPVEVSVHTVRSALEGAMRDDDRGAGEPSHALVGTIFHQVHKGLAGDDPETSAASFLLGLEREREVWHRAAAQHAYDKLLGPRLASNRARLQGLSRQVLHLWTATRQLAAWIADLVWEVAGNEGGTPLEVRLQPEFELAATLDDHRWQAPVRLIGVADAMVQGSGGFCAVELKIGRTAPVLDLAQAALYHLLASSLERGDGRATRDGAIALVTFEPEKRERLILAAEVESVRERLIALIGDVAGVAPLARSSARPPAATTASSASGEAPRSTVSSAGAAAAPAATRSTEPSATPVDTRNEATPEHIEIGSKMRAAFRSYRVAIDVEGVPLVGPRFLRFFVRLQRGASLAALERCTEEVGYALQIPKPITSRADHRLALDVARPDPASIHFRAIHHLLPRDSARGSARMLAGVAIDGTLRLIDLADPADAHVLVAGSTGSGKTEWLRTALASLALANTPETLGFILVDPKQTAFGELARSPFLWDAKSFSTASSPDEVIELLEALQREMERRYNLLREANCDDLAALRSKVGRAPRRLVFVCDEYFALATSGARADRAELERLIGILGAKARAAGIHLVIALQQASRAVISGAIDGNIPVRVALRTAKDIDSRLVLGQSGAEALTGKGDLLFRSTGDVQRLQAPLLEAAERAAIFAGTPIA